MAKILIVDDESEFTDMLALRLNKQGGYETLKAYDGEEGLRLAQEKHPDLILLDIMLPKMDGFEVYKQLKAQPATSAIPVIVLTASISLSTMSKFMTDGAFDYVTKPFEPAELMDRIKKCLNRP